MKTIKVDSKGRININDFKEYLDPKKVKLVQFKKLGSGSVAMAFYDAEGKIIPLEVKK